MRFALKSCETNDSSLLMVRRVWSLKNRLKPSAQLTIMFSSLFI